MDRAWEVFLGGHEEGGDGSRLVPVSASEASSAENCAHAHLLRLRSRGVASTGHRTSVKIETCVLKFDGTDFEATSAPTHIFSDCEPEVSPTLVAVASVKIETCALKFVAVALACSSCDRVGPAQNFQESAPSFDIESRPERVSG